MVMRIPPRTIILTLKKNNLHISRTASELGMYRSTVYRWMKRARTYRKQLTSNVQRKSTKPKTIHYKLTPSQMDQISCLRKTCSFSAAKIAKYLDIPASKSTIHRFLIKRKLVRKYGYHIRPYFQETIHMHKGNTKTIGYLQMDVKYITPALSGLPWTCFEYAVIDIYSRYKDAVILNQLDSNGAAIALNELVARLPFKPVFIQTDNGLEFQGLFLEFCKQLGLKHHFIHKNTPNENAIIERSFRTDEDEFFFWQNQPFKDYDDLRLKFSDFLQFYNHKRPHFGIDLQTPYQIIKQEVLQLS